MTLLELIQELTSYMEHNKWQKKKVKFDTISKFNLDFLSIYCDGKKVIIDVGTEEDNIVRNYLGSKEEK